MDELTIHIEWEGPYSRSELVKLGNENRDYGIHAIYGHHPVYGAGTLLYIGKAQDRTFARRIPEGDWDKGSMEDPAHIEIYVGRLKGALTPPVRNWCKEIDLAEKLLIHAHGPAYNTQQIRAVAETDPDVCRTRVLNWGCHRAIQPEVSGLRWTKATTEEAKAYKIYQEPSSPGKSPEERCLTPS